MVTIDRHWADENLDVTKPIRIDSSLKQTLGICDPCYVIRIHRDAPFYPISNDRTRPVYYVVIMDANGNEYDGKDLVCGLDTFSIAQFDYYADEEDFIQDNQQ